MIEKIFDTIGSIITGFMANLTEGINGMSSLIWNVEAQSLTTFGVLCLLSLGIGVVYWIFSLFRNLIKARG